MHKLAQCIKASRFFVVGHVICRRSRQTRQVRRRCMHLDRRAKVFFSLGNNLVRPPKKCTNFQRQIRICALWIRGNKATRRFLAFMKELARVLQQLQGHMASSKVTHYRNPMQHNQEATSPHQFPRPNQDFSLLSPHQYHQASF